MAVLVKPEMATIDAITKGGEGIYHREPIAEGAEYLGDSVTLYARITLEPGTKLAYHQHVGDSEIYYVLEGEGVYNDNGTLVPARPGDVFHCADGEWHCMENTGDTKLSFMALIIAS